MLVSGVVVACLDAQMAGILQRYTADYSTLFLMPAVLLAFVANDALSARAKPMRVSSSLGNRTPYICEEFKLRWH